MTSFPSIRSDYYNKFSNYSGIEKISAAIALEPPTSVSYAHRESNSRHAQIHYLSRAYLAWASNQGGSTGTLGFYGSYALRAYSHFYKARNVREIYSKDSVPQNEVPNLKRKHMIEAAKSVALLGVSILIPAIAYPLSIANGIASDAMVLASAVKERNKVLIAEKVASIAIKAFALFTIFYPDPISKIVLLTLKILETSYHIYKAMNRPVGVIHRFGPIMPALIELQAQVPALLSAVRAA